MKTIVSVNGSPRREWNTGTLVREAAEGARGEGAEIRHFDLYRLEKYTGCISCFACKLAPNEGRCVCRDGLAPVLEAIRNADGLILGTPNYLGDISAGLRALYERLIFQSLTYQTERRSYSDRKIPVLLIMTSNAPLAYYEPSGYMDRLRGYQETLGAFVGPTRLLIGDNTVQVEDYSRFRWTMFDPEAKKQHREEVFPEQRKEAFALGAEMVSRPW